MTQDWEMFKKYEGEFKKELEKNFLEALEEMGKEKFGELDFFPQQEHWPDSRWRAADGCCHQTKPIGFRCDDCPFKDL